jgi:hypothetical protein
MTVYVVIYSCGYEGEHNTVISGICSTIEKAMERFISTVDDAKCCDIDYNWTYDETETEFWTQEPDRCSRNWIHIWIEAREVE